MMKMSKQPIGKTLLRNVIRHTDAHNKIQEEMEMWKMREWETHTSQRKHLSPAASMRGHMHCDQELDPSRRISRSRVSEHDDREARYWTKQLYEFEAKDPDRWGHSGFKELYPEEFSSDSDSSDSQKMIRAKGKKSKSGKEAKHSKKSSRKKKKKKKKKDEENKRKKAESGSSDGESDDSGAAKDRPRQRKRTKSRHKNKKSAKKRRDSDSSSVDSDSEKEKERQTSRRKKRKQGSHKPTDSEPDSKRKRKDWRAAGEESSDGSSGD